MKAEINRGQIEKKLQAAKDEIRDIEDEALLQAAIWVATRSPVDTGTYVKNHTIGLGNSLPPAPVTNSTNQPKSLDPNGDIQSAISDMYAQILSLPDERKRVSIGNTSDHAEEVEYTHGYGVYASLRAAWVQLKEEAVNKVRSKG